MTNRVDRLEGHIEHGVERGSHKGTSRAVTVAVIRTFQDLGKYEAGRYDGVPSYPTQ